MLGPQQFVKMLSRRTTAALQSDWSVLPTLRGSTWKWTAEHIFALAAPQYLSKEGATKTACRSLVESAKNLAKHLQSGVVGSGPHRIPIKGDVTLLPRAAGLSNLEKQMARSMCWIAKHLPGTQALRQLMGHRQFGARVVHGDCLFITMSPDPVKSAMVLRGALPPD